MSPARRPTAPLRDAAPLPAGAPVPCHPTLGQAALRGQRGPSDHAALTVAAVVATAAFAGHAAAGHALVRFQLVPRRHGGLAGPRLTGSILPRDREELVAPRAAQRGHAAVGEVRSMAAARAYEIWIGRIFRSGHGPLAGRRAPQLEEGAGHRQRPPAAPQLRLPRREPHDTVPIAPPQPASRRRPRPGPSSDTHLVAH